MTKQKQRKFVDKCFKNKQGDILLWQKPNLPLYLWFACFLLLKFFVNLEVTGSVINTLELLKFGFIFVWAYLELFAGENYFRRFLGLALIFIIIYGKING